jgi:hypothetical protein
MATPIAWDDGLSARVEWSASLERSFTFSLDEAVYVLPCLRLVAVAGTEVALASPARAEVQQVLETIRCESREDRQQERAYPSSGSVTLHVKIQLGSTTTASGCAPIARAPGT